ncbi:Hsp20/alpha crystallin family protein [Salibacterium aidingense]|uniref:Hsp20/alpha crystallin family protein n=1 Tax=Salibacterium aidingense TaxID=384933 RepID=UPI000422A11A|nr:Hsp20/alpha crystallin family protein [Salibacterium aidingense]
MADLFPKRNRDFFNWLPNLFDKDSTTDLFERPFGLQYPKVDVKDENNHYLVEAELPGFSKDDVTVEYKNGYITLEGRKEQSTETNDENNNYIRKERSYGSFQRSFYVGDVNEENIDGNFSNGLLTLKIPKTRDSLEDSSGYRIDLN